MVWGRRVYGLEEVDKFENSGDSMWKILCKENGSYINATLGGRDTPTHRS